jgi:hypothetical protein
MVGAGAALTWAIAMLVIHPLMASHADSSTKALICIPFAALCLVAIGGAQWLELRRHIRRAHAWIGWTALAWVLALPLSFAPAPLVDESTPTGVHVVLWGSAGVLMALVMASITWIGVQRLAVRAVTTPGSTK